MSDIALDESYEWDTDDADLARCSLCYLIRPVRKMGSQQLCKGCYSDTHTEEVKA